MVKGRLSPMTSPTPKTETRIPSLGHGMGVGAKAPAKVYTGTEMLGITVLHKSCLQPVFTKDQAVEAAQMRRN